MQFQFNPASISSQADSDLDWSGFGAFDDGTTHQPFPAEACTEVGFDNLPPLPGFAQPNLSRVLFCAALAVAIVGCSFVFCEPAEPAAALEAVADTQAAAFGYGVASSGVRP